MTSPANILKDRLRQDLKVAMQAKRGETAKVLRVILAAIDNAEAVPITESRATQPARFGDGSAEAPRRRLSPDELAQLLQGEIDARLAAAADYERLGRAEEGARLRLAATLVERYRTD